MDSQSQPSPHLPKLEIALLLYVSAMILITGGTALSAYIRVEAFAPTHILAAFVYPLPWVCVVLFVITLTQRAKTAINTHSFSRLIVNLLLLMCCFRGLEGAGAALGGGSFTLVVEFGLVSMIAVLLFKASQKDWMPQPAALFPGLLLGIILVLASNAIINLLIYDAASNPTRFLLFAIMNLGAIGVTVAIAGLFDVKKTYRILIGGLSLCAALILMYVNRIYLLSVPKYYAHICLAFLEWMAIFGFFTWIRFRLKKPKYVYYLTGFILIAGAFSLTFLERNPEAPIPRRLDPSTDLFAHPWQIFDFDQDGFLSPRLGGLDCQEWNQKIHPMANDSPGLDRNCNGVIGKPLVRPATKNPKKDADLMLLITIDQLRADRMSVYGYANKTTPTLDALSDEFIRFENAYAPGGITTISLPSFNSNSYILGAPMNTVFRTTQHRYVQNGDELDEGEFLDTPFLSPKPARIAWISQDYKKFGKDTAAVIDDHGQRLAETVFGMNGVFDTLENVKYLGGTSAAIVTKSGIDALKNKNLGYLWLHYYDPHASPRVCTMFDVSGNIGCYDESIFAVDNQLGILFAELKRQGKWDATFIAISSDHGESFGEHHFQFHGLNSHEESVKVPLLVKFPKNFKFRKKMSAVIQTNVSVLDAIASGLLATGLQSVGHGHPLDDVSTRLFPVLSYRVILDAFGRPFEQNILLVDGDQRIFFDRIRGTTRVFSLDKDPDQRHPYFDEQAQRKIFEAIDKVGVNPIRK